MEIKVALTIEERFYDKVMPVEDGCHLWTAYIMPNGYGRFAYPRGSLAHRFAYELAVGPIPDGLQIDHLCRVRCCVNPAHLEPVTHNENHVRAAGDECLYGHPRTPENTQVIRLPDGFTRPRCKPCSNWYCRELYHKKKKEAV